MLLLYLATRSRQDVDNMYEDITHPIWTHRETNEDLEEKMAHFKTPCLQPLRRIQTNLIDFREHLQSLNGREERKDEKGPHFWRTQCRSYYPSSGPAEQFPHILADLRDCNDVFCTFVRQIEQNKSRDISSPSMLRAVKDPSCHRATKCHFLCCQRASQDLYESLSGIWSCHEASAHSLTIALDLNDSKVGGPISPGSIRFRLNLKTAISSRPFQLAVDSSQSTNCSCHSVDDSLLSNVPRNGISESNLADSEYNEKTSALGESPDGHNAHGIERRNFGVETCPDLAENEVDDLGQEENLCSLLENLSCAMDTYMSDSGGTRQSHSFSLFGRGLHGQGSHSLDDILMRAKTQSLAISLEDRLRMALSVATGVLYLHWTSWIPQSWGSKDIMISENNHSGDGFRVEDIFLRAQLENSTIEYSVPERLSFTSVDNPFITIIKKKLEIAFSAPLRELQVPEEFTSGLVKQERDHLTLLRLSETVSRELGSRYAKVVRTCFSQIFRPQDRHSLRKPELDDIMVNHVVKELEESLRAVLSVEKAKLQNGHFLHSFANFLTANQCLLLYLLAITP